MVSYHVCAQSVMAGKNDDAYIGDSGGMTSFSCYERYVDSGVAMLSQVTTTSCSASRREVLAFTELTLG
jgi:hypothetical protein